mmetsp:Transcript_23205/g.66925  ORF Transcript_23205/g.66925 Transcript_23205/m.66925 type:complete len:129 (-) Transcript_23205:118-504(-)
MVAAEVAPSVSNVAGTMRNISQTLHSLPTAGAVQQRIKDDLSNQIDQVMKITDEASQTQVETTNNNEDVKYAFTCLELRAQRMQEDLSYLTSWQRQLCCGKRTTMSVLANHSDFMARWAMEWSPKVAA